MEAVKTQYPERKLIAVLELHTYSSLNADFMKEYAGAMDPADEAAVFYSGHALEIKRMPYLEPAVIREGFGRKDLKVFTSRADLEKWLDGHSYPNANLLMMSSGDYEGLDLAGLKNIYPYRTLNYNNVCFTTQPSPRRDRPGDYRHQRCHRSYY